MQKTKIEEINHHPLEGDLTIKVVDSLQDITDQDKLLFRCEFWGVWLRDDGYLIYKTFNSSRPRILIVDRSFKTGFITGDFSLNGNVISYPLKDLDIILMVNWLGSMGDILLHASGVILDDHGYAFIGHSGEGKSTLASIMARNHDVLILGEDNLVLRHLEGQFWIFGTPWHENPTMCSPQGFPLERIYFLEKKKAEGVEKIKSIESVSRILQTAFIPFYQREYLSKILDRLRFASENMPFYTLSYPLPTDPYDMIMRG